MTRVFIDGREGTTGLRIEQRLQGRRDVELTILPEGLRKSTAARKEALNGADIAFLCLPDAAAREAVGLIENNRTRVIDASTAHRTHPAWAYGLPELSPRHKQAVQNGMRVALPGCHASGFIALAYPLVQAGLLKRDAPFTCISLTGYSGGGKGMIGQYQSQGRAPEYSAPRQYALSQAHKHLPEMKAVCGLARDVMFHPIVADYYAGMLVTLPLHSMCGLGQAHACLSEAYAGKPLVRVMPLGEEPAFMAANALAGRDDMELYVTGNDSRVALLARFDNLGKGASGAAVECMNIMLGMEETHGLTL